MEQELSKHSPAEDYAELLRAVKTTENSGLIRLFLPPMFIFGELASDSEEDKQELLSEVFGGEAIIVNDEIPDLGNKDYCLLRALSVEFYDDPENPEKKCFRLICENLGEIYDC